MLSPAIPTIIGSTSISASAANVIITLSAAVGAGEFVIAGAGLLAVSITISSISDSRGNAYQVDATNNTAGARSDFVISGKATTPLLVGDTITINFSGGGAGQRRFYAYKTSNLDPTTWKQASAATIATSAAPNSGNISVTGAYVLIFGYCQYNAAGNAYTQGAGYTLLENLQGQVQNWIATEYKIVSTGTYVADGSITNTTWHQIGVAYVGAPSGGGNLTMMGIG